MVIDLDCYNVYSSILIILLFFCSWCTSYILHQITCYCHQPSLIPHQTYPMKDQIGLEWRKIVLGYWYDGMLDSSIWCGSTMSSLEYAPSMLTRCFLVDLSALGLPAGEPKSSVGVSWWDERDLIERLFAGAHSLAAFSGSGVGGSVLLSGSGQVSSRTVPVIPEPGTSERTLLSSCCSSIIFYEYLRWASILNCSCLWTCFILEDNYKLGCLFYPFLSRKPKLRNYKGKRMFYLYL